ncbi:MAG: hypothetical protein ABI458_01255 [Chloroflexota bacterium]
MVPGEHDASVTIDQHIAGRFAIASGIVTILAAIVLVIFFLVEAPALVESGDVDRITIFGSSNDALIALALLLLVPVAMFVRRAGEPRRLHNVAGFVGLVGLGLGVVFMITTALRVIDYGTNSILIGVAFVMVGIWLLAANLSAGASALFSRGARWAGVLAGLAFLSIGGFAAIAGPSATADPTTLMSSPVLVALLGAGTAGLHLATPVWAILTGRHWIATTQGSA